MKWWITAVLVAVAGVASAQTVNPSRVEWETEDHAITARYEVGYYLAGAASPVQTASIAKTAVVASGAAYTAPLPRPVLGAFVAKMRACAPDVSGSEVCSEWSDASGPFVLSPRRIVGLKVAP